MNFNFHAISLVTLFGFFEDKQCQNPRHVQIPIDPQVQAEICAMLVNTINKLGLPASAATMPTFDPAEKYGSEEPLKLPLATPYVQDLAATVALRNLPSDPNALNLVAELEYYYAVFIDDQGRALYAFRRASQFKGVTKSKLALVNGGVLTLLSSTVFRLDSDFDYLVTDQDIFILRPSGFEFTTNIHGQILQASAANAMAIAASVTYLDVKGIVAYASKHPRSARLLAAIRSRNDLHLIDRSLLTQSCHSYGIQIHNANPNQGQLSPAAGHEYDFLCILDRRAYTANLIPNLPEKYEAASRVQR